MAALVEERRGPRRARIYGFPVKTILTENNREFSGRPEHHSYQLLLALQDIAHRSVE